MTKATDTTLLRKGETQNDWYEENAEVAISTHDKKLSFELKIPSKGGGTTCLRLLVGREDFEAVVDRLMECDWNESLKMFAAKVHTAIDIQPDIDDMRKRRHEREVNTLRSIIRNLQAEKQPKVA
jgi:hypothetical protein